jgi:hypothetical protein
MPIQEFKYSRLTGERSIRLISIRALQEPQEADRGSIQIDLGTHDDRNITSYLALSYTWNPPRAEDPAVYEVGNRRRIVVNDSHYLLVTPNLFDALVQLRESFPRELLWVDAICINQTDNDEKAFQVDRMDQIYRKASLVVVWVGKDHDEPRTVQLVKIFQSLDKASAKDFYNGLLRNFSIRDPFDDGHGDEPRQIIKRAEFASLIRTLQRLDLPMPDSELWDTAAQFFRRRWFARIWIIQEVVLARELVVLLGHHLIPWRSVVRCIELLSASSILNTVISRKDLATGRNILEDAVVRNESDTGKRLEINVKNQRETRLRQQDNRDKLNFDTAIMILSLGAWFNSLIGNTTSPFLSGRKDNTLGFPITIPKLST